MKTIWKYPIIITDRQTITIPVDAEILTVALQDDIPCIWAMVDTEVPPEIRHIEIFGTGNPIPFERGITNRKYIGSLHQNYFVWHVFENLEIWKFD